MKGAGMLVGNFELNRLKETDLGAAQAFLTPKRDHGVIENFDYMNRVNNFFACNSKRDLRG